MSPPVAAGDDVGGPVHGGNLATVSSIQPQEVSKARERIFLQGRYGPRPGGSQGSIPSYC